jgi:hypothetical protein
VPDHPRLPPKQLRGEDLNLLFQDQNLAGYRLPHPGIAAASLGAEKPRTMRAIAAGMDG